MGRKLALSISLLVLLISSMMLAACSSAAPSTTAPAKPSTTVAPAPAPASSVPAATTKAPAPTTTAPATTAASPTAKPSAAPSTSAAAYIPYDKQELPKYFVAFAAPGGQGQTQASAFSTLISKYSPLKASVTLMGGGLVAAVDPIRKGEMDWFAMSPANPMGLYTGLTTKPPLRMRQWFTRDASVAGNVLGIWLPANSPIKSGKDLKGKRIAVIPGITWSLNMVLGIMQSYGFTKDDFTSVSISDYDAGFTMLAEKRIDALTCITGPQTQQASVTSGVTLLPFTKEETAAIQKLEPYLDDGMIPASYLGTPAAPTWGIVVPDAFFVRADLNEKTVYTALKALLENSQEIWSVDTRMKMVKLETSCSDSGWRMPFHPGSIRFFQEKKLWTAANTAKQKALLDTERKIYGDISDEAAFRAVGILP